MPGAFRNLRAWQLGIDLANAIYSTTETWPHREVYGLSSQARRAAFSVPAHIAEGRGRQGRREYQHFVEIAYGSLCELETAIHLAVCQTYVSKAEEAQLMEIVDELSKVLRGLIRSLDPP